MITALALAATALFPKNAPEATRLKAISRFFSPRPGEAFALEARDRRDYKKTPVLKMRGFIDVTPPKGVCLTIKLTDEDPDEIICKPRKLAFAISQLDRQGRLTWRITTGEQDPGTDLTWPSPYRMAFVTPWDAAEDDPQVYRFIEACEPSVSPDTGRKITLRLLGGDNWTIRFPDKDTALPQPDDEPNLFMYTSNAKVSVTQAAKKPEGESSHETPEAEPVTAPPPTKISEGEPITPKDPNDNIADRKWWAIPLRGAYDMSASAFQPSGSVAGRMLGRCRYNFESGADDPGVGRLECHDVDGFKKILLPLTCIKELGPRR